MKKSQAIEFSSTQTRGRTGMDVTPLVFETSASTDSAIWAFLNSGAKIHKISIPASFYVKNVKIKFI